MIKEELKKLEDILKHKNKIEKDKEALPKEKEKEVLTLNEMKKKFLKSSEEISRCKEALSSDTIELQVLLDERKKNENEYLRLTTQKEFDSITKQIKASEDKEQDLNSRMKVAKTNLEKLEGEHKKLEELVMYQEKLVKGLEEKFDEEVAKKNVDISKLQEEQVRLSKNFTPEFIVKFDRIIKSKGGEGIALLSSGICTGCNMILSVKFLNILKEADDKTPNFCPYCSRVIFYDPTGKDDEYLSLEVEDSEDQDSTEENRLLGDGDDDFEEDDEFDEDEFDDEGDGDEIEEEPDDDVENFDE